MITQTFPIIHTYVFTYIFVFTYVIATPCMHECLRM